MSVVGGGLIDNDLKFNEIEIPKNSIQKIGLVYKKDKTYIDYMGFRKNNSNLVTLADCPQPTKNGEVVYAFSLQIFKSTSATVSGDDVDTIRSYYGPDFKIYYKDLKYDFPGYDDYMNAVGTTPKYSEYYFSVNSNNKYSFGQNSADPYSTIGEDCIFGVPFKYYGITINESLELVTPKGSNLTGIVLLHDNSGNLKIWQLDSRRYGKVSTIPSETYGYAMGFVGDLYKKSYGDSDWSYIGGNAQYGYTTKPSSSQFDLTYLYIVVGEHGHTWTTKYDSENHWQECVEDHEIKDLEPHSFGDWKVQTPSTCATYGTEVRRCTVCGYSETRNIKELAQHDFLEYVVSEPSCSSDGMLNRICQMCGYSEHETIPKLENEIDRSFWLSNETSHWHYGTCIEKNDLGNHIENEGVIVEKSTLFKEGLKEYYCAVCGRFLRLEIVPKKRVKVVWSNRKWK